MNHRVRRIIWGGMLSFSIAVALLAFVVGTEIGLYGSLWLVGRLTPLMIEAEHLHGNLARGARTQRLFVHAPRVDIQIDELDFRWQLWGLWRKKWLIQQLSAQNIDIWQRLSGETTLSAESGQSEELGRGWQLLLDRMKIQQLRYFPLGAPEPWYLQQATASVALHPGHGSMIDVDMGSAHGTLGHCLLEAKEGRFDLDGDGHDYQFSMYANLGVCEQDIGEWGLVGYGDSERLMVDQFLSGTLSADVQGQLSWARAPKVHIRAELDVQNLKPEELNSAWPGHLAAELRVDWQQHKRGALLNLERFVVEGELKERLMHAKARGRWRSGGVPVGQLDMTWGDDVVELRSRSRALWQAEFETRISDLALWQTRGAGRWDVHATMDGPIETPQFIYQLSAHNARWQQYAVADLEHTAKLSWGQHPAWELGVRASEIDWNGHQVAIWQGSSSGDFKQHQLQTQLQNEMGLWKLQAQGSWHDASWQGSINQLEWQQPQGNHWQLQQTVPLLWGANRFELLRPLCLQQADASGCLAFQWHESMGRLNWQAKAMPLAVLEPWIPGSELVGLTDMSLDLELGSQLHGQWEWLLHPGHLDFYRDNSQIQTLRYQGGYWRGKIQRDRVSSQWEWRLWDGMKLEGFFDLPEWQWPVNAGWLQQPIAGKISGQFPNLEMMELFVDELENVQGELTLDMEVVGHLSDPIWDGQANLLLHEFFIPRLGMQYHNLSLQAIAQNEPVWHLQGLVGDGEGALQIIGQAGFREAAFQTELLVQGDQIQLFNLPEIELWASPRLSLSHHQQQFKMDGDLFVPKAEIRPNDFSNALTSSNDVIVLDSSRKQTRRQVGSESQLLLKLGDSVHVSGHGLDARITGSLSLHDQTDRVTTASGQLNIVNGEYTVYGKTLAIQKGHLIFNGGPVHNPNLDIRASRSVDILARSDTPFKLIQLDEIASGGDSKVQVSGEVGVEVTGSMREPLVRLFSEPALPQADQLSYLVFGLPSSQLTGGQGELMMRAASEIAGFFRGDGQPWSDSLLKGLIIDEVSIGSRTNLDPDTGQLVSQPTLVLGKNVNKRLSLGYITGLFNAFNSLTLKYQLDDHWYLQGEAANVGDSGADLFYSIETD